jgi:hypothetical protein
MAAALEAEAKQREQAERELCQGILRPIGYDSHRDPSEAELRAFADWSALPENRMKSKVLEVTFNKVSRALDALLTIIEKSDSWDALESAGNGLTAFAPRLEPTQVNRAWDVLLELLDARMPRSVWDDFHWESHYALYAADICLAALAPRLEPTQVNRAWDGLPSSDSLYPLTISFNLKVKLKGPKNRLVLAPNGISADSCSE